MATPIAALDIGTTKTCVLIGEINDAGITRILGAGVAPSRGMRKGVVTDVKEAALAIASAAEQAERVSGIKIPGVYVGIAGAHIQSTNSRGVAGIHGGRGVAQEDVDRAMEAAEAIAVPHNREIIHAIPRGYMLDGQDGIKDPLGMVGFRLEVEAHVVTGAAASIQNLVKAVEGAGLKALDYALEPIAAGEAVLTAAEKEMGVVLADIGGGTTDIAIFIDGSVWHTVILPTGGLHITNDLAVGLRTPFNAAEEMKMLYGHADPNQIADTDLIDVAAFGDEGRRTVSRHDIAEIISARVDEILQMILTQVKRSGYDNLLPAGVVLCGGTAELAGLKIFARDVLQMPVRVGVPRELEGFTDRVSAPAYATTVGLLQWGWQQAQVNAPEAQRAARNGHNKSNPLGRLFGWTKHLLPES
ncbi:MAG: cell division protein FtsA [Chloroflexi bacterium]|nr:cell division protein FtsA [Chloroflexota bacterium]